MMDDALIHRFRESLKWVKWRKYRLKSRYAYYDAGGGIYIVKDNSTCAIWIELAASPQRALGKVLLRNANGEESENHANPTG